MLKAIKIRIYPNQPMREFFSRQFGACRWVYNHGLALRTETWLKEKKSVSRSALSKMLTDAKKKKETAWLADVNAQALQQSLRHLEVAYQKFWKKEAQFPKFKKRGNHQSFTVPQNFNIEGGKLRLPKCEPIRMQRKVQIALPIQKVTISMTPTGRYFASFLVEAPQPKILKKTDKVIGVDLGLTSFLVTSDGKKVESPKFLKRSSRRLRLRQRSLSRRAKGSRGRERQRIFVARSHERVSDQRQDFLHKLSTQLIRENQAIAVESLNVKGMMKNHHLAKAISDQGWGQFLSMLRYKADWYGRTILVVDRFFPSSKRCFACGWINENLSLNIRSWKCPSCLTAHDRDINAAKNILNCALSATTAGMAESHAVGDRRSQRSRKVSSAGRRTRKPPTLVVGE